MNRHNVTRHAFTLVELIVSMSVIAVLVALSIRGILAARETSRCSTCSIQMRQIGIGLFRHQDDVGVLPSNGGWDGVQTITSLERERIQVYTKTRADGVVYHWGVGDPTLPARQQTGSWAYAILPYIEQRNLHDRVIYDAAVATFVCPSRRDAIVAIPEDDADALYSGGGWAWGKIDYAANGLLVRPRPVCANLSQITDGASCTVLVGEKAMDSEHVDRTGWFWDEPFLLGGSYATARTGHEILPDLEGTYFRNNWGSPHRAGPNFLFADGSVRVLRFGTPGPVVLGLLTPDGGEIAGVD